ncbi:MAG: DNA/RNA non-specific endonuclease [Muribaculaceae bacterium]|nr:DNA/RNA non-specific endonuclease [Muribaculaceae bacterium]
MAKKRVNRTKARKGRAGIRVSWRVGMSLLVVAVLYVGLRYVALDPDRVAAATDGVARRMGLVTGLERTVTAPSLDEVEVRYGAMTVSFNPELHIPNWVGWELTREKASGTEPRADRFMRDDNVRGCASPEDYRGSGYDRGHMAPAADMKWDVKAMRKSFLLTNVCPQDHALNAGSWKKLEEKCRMWAMADSVIYIVAGPVLTDTIDEYIGESGVAVPKRFFKVIASPYADPPRGIGFIMPNGRVPGGMQASAMSIDDVEAITGHDFFSELPDDVEAVVESQCRFNLWSTLRP